MPFNLAFSDVFLMVRLGLWVLGRKTTEMKCPSHHIISKVHKISTRFITDDVNLDHPAKVTFARFLHCSFPPFHHCPFHGPVFGTLLLSRAQLREWEVKFPLQKGGAST